MHNILFIVLSVSLSGVAQLLLKYGLDGKAIELSWNTIVYLFSNIYVLSGLISYFLSMILRFKVLSDFDVSFAYPFVALSFIIVAIGGYFFGEQLSFYKIIGIITILVGIILITRG